jgi:Spy/CpxP family protein refolding chaperone
MTKRILIGVFTGLFVFSGILLAKQPGAAPRMHRLDRILDLSDEQKSQMLDLHLQLEKEVLPLQSEIEKLHADLKGEMIAEKFNEASVKKLLDRISDLRQNIQYKRIMNQRAVRDLLTADQKKKFDLHILSRDHGWKERGIRDVPRGPRPPMHRDFQEE